MTDPKSAAKPGSIHLCIHPKIYLKEERDSVIILALLGKTIIWKEYIMVDFIRQVEILKYGSENKHLRIKKS